jgi:aquaporin Z
MARKSTPPTPPGSGTPGGPGEPTEAVPSATAVPPRIEAGSPADVPELDESADAELVELDADTETADTADTPGTADDQVLELDDAPATGGSRASGATALETPYELDDDDDEDDEDDDDDPRDGPDPLYAPGARRRYDSDRVGLGATGPGLGVRLGAEALGTFGLVLVILGVALYNPLSSVGTVGLALAAGLVLTGLTSSLGHVSGGHFNPAVSLASTIGGRTSWGDLPLYWLAQVVGAVAAAGAIVLSVPSELPGLIGGDPATGEPGTLRSFMSVAANGFGEQSPLFALAGGQVTFDLRSALITEALAAAILTAVYLGSTHRRSTLVPLRARHEVDGVRSSHVEANRSTLHRSAPIAIGLTYAALMLLVSPITGGSLNPARATASAVFAEPEALRQLWLFWAAPLLAAVIVGLIYRAVVVPSDDDLDLDDDSDDDDSDDDLDDDEETDLLVERR